MAQWRIIIVLIYVEHQRKDSPHFNPPGNEEEENCRRRGEQQFAIQTIEEVAQLERRMFRST